MLRYLASQNSDARLSAWFSFFPPMVLRSSGLGGSPIDRRSESSAFFLPNANPKISFAIRLVLFFGLNKKSPAKKTK